jgi:hypothetical protein
LFVQISGSHLILIPAQVGEARLVQSPKL